MEHVCNVIYKTTVAAIILIASLVVLPVRAATVTQANDYLSSLVAGASANHAVVFTTPSGVSEGETISLTFSNTFSTVGLTENDVDLADDGVDLTTASDCSGAEQASVSIVGSVVTFTICAGDGGAIAGGSIVTIEIGTNATASGVGSVQMTNPGTVGTFYLSLAGTFGDSGSIAFPIGTQGPVTVSATIPAVGGGGGGGGEQGGGGAPVPADVHAPVISEVVVSDVTATGATITWNTNEPGNSWVDYGVTPAFEIGTQSEVAFVNAHSVSLRALNQGTTYRFRVRSIDFDGNVAVSPAFQFSTLDQTAPVISNIVVSNITTTSAQIAWTTNEPASSIVDYGRTVAYGRSSSNQALMMNHSLVLVGLTQNTTYHLRAGSIDASANRANSADQVFTTLQDNPPANVSRLNLHEGNGHLTLSWINPADADLAGIRVRVCSNEMPTDVVDADCVTVFEGLAQNFVHNGLTNGTTYYYGVFAYDRAGQFSSGALGSGAPKAPEAERPVDVPLPEPEEEHHGEVPEVVPVVPQEVQPGVQEDEQPVTPLGAEETGKLALEDLDFIVAREIELTPSPFGTVDVLGQEPLRIRVPASELPVPLKTATVQIGEQAYLLRLSEDAQFYQTDVLTPLEVQSFPFEFIAVSTDARESHVSSILRVVDRGYVKENIDGEETRVLGVRVNLHQKVGDEVVAWDGSPYGEFNPQTSGDGSYQFYVPNGLYVLRATAQGYRDYDSGSFAVTNHLVNATFILTASPPQEEPVVPQSQTSAPTTTQAPVSASTSFLGSVLRSASLQAAVTALEAVREHPAVQTTANVATPTLAVTAGASVVLMTVAFDFIPLLHYLFTAPVLLLWRKKRKDFGIVYNANTKTPVDLAVVRLYHYDPQNPTGLGTLVKSRVTDKAGRFFFLAAPGQYKIVVSKRSFVYPASSLTNKKEDGDFIDLYHGEPLTVGLENTIITPNIPLDPQNPTKELTPKRVVFQRRLRVLQSIVATSGLVLSVGVAIVRPSMLAAAMIAIQAGVYVLAQRLAKPARPKNWGIVYDNQTKRPLANVVARIFDPQYDKLLDMQVSDSKGQYAFLLGSGRYYAVFEKPGYSPAEVRPIEVDLKKGSGGFSADITLSKH